MQPRNQGPTRDLLIRFRDYHAKNPAWGSLHVVLEDGNIGDSFVQFCISYASHEADSEGVDLARELLKMSKGQRIKLGAGKYVIPELPVIPELTDDQLAAIHAASGNLPVPNIEPF